MAIKGLDVAMTAEEAFGDCLEAALQPLVGRPYNAETRADFERLAAHAMEQFEHAYLADIP